MIPLLVRGLLLLTALKSFAKIALGIFSASAIYYVLNETVVPKIRQFESDVLGRVDQLSTTIGTVGEVLIYMDFVSLVQILFATGGALIALKIYILALRAFGINVS